MLLFLCQTHRAARLGWQPKGGCYLRGTVLLSDEHLSLRKGPWAAVSASGPAGYSWPHSETFRN